MFQWFRERGRTRRIGREIYDSIVAQARAEPFYRDLAVPDTPEGRLELIVLHIHLVLQRLASEGEAGANLSRAISETFVADMDDSMREMGIGDLGVPRRVKRAAAAVYDRGRVYHAAQQSEDVEALAGALAEHVYMQGCADPASPAKLASYVRRAGVELDRVPSAALLDGQLRFPDVIAS
jgi:cytochrome b pre-mRNA-processing protein 3